ncbi:MAG TPA: Ig-like domain-containing protein, partial [Anaerolineaceae bacterium]|nr:Ig-like domain-containing protein [Anaerolineaceae bacterium]
GLYGEDAVTFTVTPVNDAPVMVENIPDQWVIHGAAFAPIELDRYISDVDNSADEINWSVAGDTNLDVTIIDRVATITQREANWSGSETVTFRGTDPEGLFAEQPVNFDVVAVKPTVGQKLTAKRVTFEWSGITNANQYNVQLSLSDTFDKILLNATTSNLRFAYGSDLANGKTYYWRIRPRFGTTWGDWSTVKTSDQKPLEFLSMNPPLAPTLKAPAAGAFLRVKDVDFDWTDVVNADHYQLQISKTTAFKDPNTYYPQPGDQPFTVHDLQDGLYYWRIRAIDEVDVAGGWSATRSFTVDTIAPAAPALIAPLAGAYTYDTTPTLAVKAVPGATWYRYRVVTKAEGEPATCEQNVVLTSDKLNKTSWSTMTPELPYGDTYYWCAQAVDAAENESPWSESEAR